MSIFHIFFFNEKRNCAINFNILLMKETNGNIKFIEHNFFHGTLFLVLEKIIMITS